MINPGDEEEWEDEIPKVPRHPHRWAKKQKRGVYMSSEEAVRIVEQELIPSFKV